MPYAQREVGTENLYICFVDSAFMNLLSYIKDYTSNFEEIAAHFVAQWDRIIISQLHVEWFTGNYRSQENEA